MKLAHRIAISVAAPGLHSIVGLAFKTPEPYFSMGLWVLSFGGVVYFSILTFFGSGLK